MFNTGIELGGIDPTFDFLVFLFGPSKQNADFSSTHDYADYADMERDYKLRGTITVNTAHSERTIFATPRLNWYFRYWHDMAHLAVGAPFDAVGERLAAEHQIRQVWALQGPTNTTKARWAAIIDTEVNGQVDYYLAHNTFPVNQREFAIAHLAAKGYNVSEFPKDVYGLTIAY